MTRTEASQRQRERIMEIRAEQQLRRAIAEADRKAGGIELDSKASAADAPPCPGLTPRD